MKGLLLKDLALVKAQMRSAIIIFAVVIFMLIAGQDTGFVIMYANIIFMTHLIMEKLSCSLFQSQRNFMYKKNMYFLWALYYVAFYYR